MQHHRKHIERSDMNNSLTCLNVDKTSLSISNTGSELRWHVKSYTQDVCH